MRLPSLEALVTAARKSASRFPLVLTAAVVAAVAGIVAVDTTNEDFWLRLMGTAALGIPLLLAIDLFAERKKWPLATRAIGWAAGVALLAAFMAAWFSWSEPVAVGRYMQASAVAHLLVAFLPFVAGKELQGFWQYNKVLLLRALVAALFSGVLFGGLAIALAAVDNLFALEVDENWYLRLWLVLAFVVTTWVFVGGVPERLDTLEQRTDYPEGLKVFAQYILAPIVVVYLVILTLYLGKVVITQEWPSGWIGWLVSSVAAAGIFSLLLVYPIAERAENRWVNTYARGFYIVLLPSIVMLWLAIWKRIDQYGVTERRYFLAALSIWLAAVALYFVIRRSRDIRIIPWSLCLVGVLTFLGPWGAYSVSEASQVRRLRNLLERNEIYRGGQVRSATQALTFEDRREVGEILRYLVSTHGTAGITEWFEGGLAEADTVGEGTKHSPGPRVDDRAQLISGLLGVPYVARWQSDRPGRFNYAVDWDEAPVPIAGFTNAVRIDALDQDSALVEGLIIRYDSTAFAIRVVERGEVVAEIPLQAVIDQAAARAMEGAERRGLPPAAMRVEVESSRINLATYVSRIAGDRTEDGVNLWDLDLQLYYTMR